MRFLITALPRSRTAWFSVLMGCRHEPTRDFKSFAELRANWPENTGFSDAALGFQLRRIVDEIGPRVLIIERDIDDVKASFLKYMADVPIRLSVLAEHLELLKSRLEDVQDHERVRRLRYESLGDVHAVKWAMSWLNPGCDKSRAEDVMRLNIQVDRKLAVEEMSAEHNGWHWKEFK